MDQVSPNPDAKSTTSDAAKRLPEMPLSDRVVQPELPASQPNNDKGKSEDKGKPWCKVVVKHLREKAKEAGLHDWLMVVFTFVLTAVACLQGCIVYQNSQSSTTQMGQVIDSANRIDDAADSFSRSAAKIDAGVGNAVTNLGVQAGATQKMYAESQKQTAQIRRQADLSQTQADQSRQALSLEQVALDALPLNLPPPVQLRLRNNSDKKTIFVTRMQVKLAYRLRNAPPPQCPPAGQKQFSQEEGRVPPGGLPYFRIPEKDEDRYTGKNFTQDDLLYVWGRFYFSDGLEPDPKPLNFCRYASLQDYADVGAIVPWTQADRAKFIPNTAVNYHPCPTMNSPDSCPDTARKKK